MPGFHLARAAEGDLQAIKDFIARHDIEAAQRVLDELERVLHRLAAMPGVGHRRGDLADERLRFWPVHGYLIVYESDRSPIRIVRVLHGSRDIRTELGPSSQGLDRWT